MSPVGTRTSPSVSQSAAAPSSLPYSSSSSEWTDIVVSWSLGQQDGMELNGMDWNGTGWGLDQGTSELIVEAGKREEDLRVVQLAVPLIFDRSTQ